MPEPGELITLQDDEGQLHEFSLVDVVEVDAHRYAVLEPASGDPAVIFRLEDDTLVTIEDDAEFERVLAVLQTSVDYAEVTLVEGDSARLRRDEPGSSH